MEDIRRTGTEWLRACEALAELSFEMSGAVAPRPDDFEQFTVASDRVSLAAVDYADAVEAAGFPRPNI